MKAQLVSKSEYARMRDCAASAVTRAIGEGRITTVDVSGRQMIDPTVADIQWQRNTRARADSRPATETIAPPEADYPISTGETLSYDEARRRRETAEANLAELKLAELRGDLVRADDVRASLAKRAAAFREGLLQIPARLSAMLAAETDQARVHTLIDAELRTVMGNLVAD